MKRYGLIGRTLSHSFSEAFFAGKFAAQGITDCLYQNFELENIEDFPALIDRYPDLKGINVTIPYKEEITRYLTWENEVVKAIGSCNCIRIKGRELKGFNTDVTGFKRSLQLHLQAHHSKALVLGTGGAAKAVCYSLKELGITFTSVSRQNLAGCLSYAAITRNIIQEHTIIINTTPLGMYPHVQSLPLLPYQFLTPMHFLFDLVYNPAKTLFLAEGEKRGAHILNGYQMLVDQAEESWRIWNEQA